MRVRVSPTRKKKVQSLWPLERDRRDLGPRRGGLGGVGDSRLGRGRRDAVGAAQQHGERDDHHEERDQDAAEQLEPERRHVARLSKKRASLLGNRDGHLNRAPGPGLTKSWHPPDKRWSPGRSGPPNWLILGGRSAGSALASSGGQDRKSVV